MERVEKVEKVEKVESWWNGGGKVVETGTMVETGVVSFAVTGGKGGKGGTGGNWPGTITTLV